VKSWLRESASEDLAHLRIFILRYTNVLVIIIIIIIIMSKYILRCRAYAWQHTKTLLNTQ